MKMHVLFISTCVSQTSGPCHVNSEKNTKLQKCLYISFAAVVPKLGENYTLGIIRDSSMGNEERKPQCCSVLQLVAFLRREILRVIRQIATLIWVTA